jgi:TM2 domain-containing membrane protein YozV
MGTNKSCLYQQRSKLIAFLVSFFVGSLGVDWFYLSCGNAGYIVAGVFKLLLACGCCGGWPLVAFGAARDSTKLVNMGRMANSLFSLGSFVWWIVDWARILTEKFPGVGLKPF